MENLNFEAQNDKHKFYSDQPACYMQLKRVAVILKTMGKFRIVKSETTNGRGESNVHYKIQKKFLFWFFDYGFTTHYHTWTEWNAGHRDEPTHAAMLTKRIFIFNTKEKAGEYLIKVQNPFSEWFKGDKIIRVFDDNSWEDVFVNKSYYGFRGSSNKIGYEYSNTLIGLKKMINGRKTETKISVV